MKNKKSLKFKTIFSALLAVGLMCAGATIPVQASEGDLWITPATQSLGADENFDVEVHMDTGGKDLGAFNVFFDFNSSDVTIDTSQGSDGLEKGADTTSYSVIVNAGDIANGHFRFGGMTVSGYASGSDVHLATIHAKTTSGFSSENSPLGLRVNELSDELGSALSTGSTTDASVTYQGAIQTYDLTNFTQLKLDWLSSGNAESDVNSDQVVNTRDLGIMMSNWAN